MADTSFSQHSRLGPHLTHQHPTKSVGYQLSTSTESLKLMLAFKGDMRLCPGCTWVTWVLSIRGSIGKFSELGALSRIRPRAKMGGTWLEKQSSVEALTLG